MRHRLLVAASAAVLLSGGAARAQVQDDGVDPCSTQPDLTQCWTREAERADEEMNAVYASLLAKLGGSAGELKRSQKAWLEYRNAHIAMLGAAGRRPPHRHTLSEILLCAAIARRQLAQQRTGQLRLLLEPASDEACPL